MTDPTAMTDGSLLAWLGRIARELDPPDPDCYALGHDAFQLFRIDDELADLVADSRESANQVRGETATARLLSFESDGLTIEIQVSGQGTSAIVLGQVVRDREPNGGRVFVETPAGTHADTVLDADDRFELRDLPASLLRLRIEANGEPVVTTTWVEF
jgi:hypothetical protein